MIKLIESFLSSYHVTVTIFSVLDARQVLSGLIEEAGDGEGMRVNLD